MLDIKFLRENPEIVKQNIKNKFQDAKLPLVDEVIELDVEKRRFLHEVEELRSSRNKYSKMIGALMGQGKRDEAEEMKKKVTENAAKLAEKLHSASHRYYFWSADRADSLCHCPQCSKYTQADLNMLSVNIISEGIRRHDPQAQVAYLAYAGSSYDVPQEIMPHESVFLEFAPYVRRFTAPINDPDHEINRRFHDALLKLLKFFPAERTHILEYWLDVSLFCNHFRDPIKPLPTTREVIRRDLEFYCSLGIKDFTTFAVGLNGEFLKQYGDQQLIDYAEILNELL